MLDVLLSPSTNLFDKIFALLGIIGIPISIIAFGFVIFFLIYPIFYRLIPKPIPKCLVCQKLEPDELSQGKPWWFLCRKHLLDKYSELFLKNTFRVVMVEFASDFNFTDPAFTYYPLSYWGKYIGKAEILKQLLDSIDLHKCIKCGRRANILFINKENAAQDKDDYIIPAEEYLTKGQYLCNKHTLDRIKPGIEAYPKPITYDGGIWLPYKEDGFQRPDEP